MYHRTSSSSKLSKVDADDEVYVQNIVYYSRKTR